MDTQFQRITNGTGSEWKAGTCLATDASVVERLKHFFSLREAHSTGTCTIEVQGNCVMFSYDGVVTAVRILEEIDLSRRNSVLEAVLSSTSLTNQVNRVYLALPKLLSAAIDGSIVEQHGIGLMVFDETTLEEVVAPKHFQAKNNSPALVGEEPYRILHDEITNLRARIDSLEGVAESMRSEIARLRSLKCSPPQIRTTSISSSPSPTEQTPSFMKDNPWVEVLSRRGQEGDRYVS